MVSGEQEEESNGGGLYNHSLGSSFNYTSAYYFSVWAHLLQLSGSRYIRIIAQLQNSANSAHSAKEKKSGLPCTLNTRQQHALVGVSFYSQADGRECDRRHRFSQRCFRTASNSTTTNMRPPVARFKNHTESHQSFSVDSSCQQKQEKHGFEHSEFWKTEPGTNTPYHGRTVVSGKADALYADQNSRSDKQEYLYTLPRAHAGPCVLLQTAFRLPRFFFYRAQQRRRQT